MCLYFIVQCLLLVFGPHDLFHCLIVQSFINLLILININEGVARDDTESSNQVLGFRCSFIHQFL